ncbi:hypothetical protein GCM10025857_24020 [Alicyclobacillus contaminans]|nr:hypothetical protein GCM10025857_24020 [Alicyclobacillus contaminans]
MKPKDIIMLLLLAALWGGSFLFMRIGAPALGPVMLIELRVLLAGITLVGLALASRHRIHILHKWWQYLVLGAANAAIPFTLISYAELRLSAGLAAILNATTPMFTALVAWLWANEPFNLKKLSGVVLGILGVGVLVGWQSGGNGPHLWLSASFSLLAALSYGVAGVFSSRYFKGKVRWIWPSVSSWRRASSWFRGVWRHFLGRPRHRLSRYPSSDWLCCVPPSPTCFTLRSSTASVR